MPRRKTQKRKQRKTKRNFKKRGGVGSPRNPASKRKLDASVGSPGHIRKKSRTSRETSTATAYEREKEAEAVAEAAAAMAAPAEAAEAAAAMAAQRPVTINKPGPGHRTRNYRRPPSRTSSNSTPSLTSPSAIPEERRLVAAEAEEESNLEKIRQTRLSQELNDITEENNEKANELGMRHITVQPTNDDIHSIRLALSKEQNKGVRYDDELRARMAARNETKYQNRKNNTLRRNARNLAVGALGALAAAGRGLGNNRNVTQKNYRPSWEYGQRQIAPPAYMKPPFGKVITDEDDVGFWYQPNLKKNNITMDTFLELGIPDAVAEYKYAVAGVANEERKKMTKKERNKRRRKATRKKKREERRRRGEAGRAEL